jgi:hypothetical protein
LATAVLRGGPFPDGAHVGPDRSPSVLWLDSLPGYERLLDCVRALATPPGIFWPVEYEADDFPVLDLTQDRSLRLVADVAASKRPIWVVVGDAVPRSASASTLARACDAMANVAQHVGCAVSFLRDNRGSTGSAGADGWADVATRITTTVTIEPWAPDSTDLVLRVSGTDGVCPEPVHVRIQERVPTVVQKLVEVPRTAADRAAAFLKRSLADGPQPAAPLIVTAKSEGISKRSLDRAKRLLGVRSYQLSGRWWWALT